MPCKKSAMNFRRFLHVRIPLPKGVTVRKARKAFSDVLGATPESVLRVALSDVLGDARRRTA